MYIHSHAVAVANTVLTVILMVDTCMYWLSGCTAVFDHEKAVDAEAECRANCKAWCTVACITVLSADAYNLVKKSISCQTERSGWFTGATCRALYWSGK